MNDTDRNWQTCQSLFYTCVLACAILKPHSFEKNLSTQKLLKNLILCTNSIKIVYFQLIYINTIIFTTIHLYNFIWVWLKIILNDFLQKKKKSLKNNEIHRKLKNNEIHRKLKNNKIHKKFIAKPIFFSQHYCRGC